jgi:threonine dehydratase
LDCIIVPVGGGGLLSGTCISARAIKKDIRIFGAEPETVDDCARSLAAGTRQTNQKGATSIADGLLTLLGSNTWPIIQKEVEEVFCVTDSEIVQGRKRVNCVLAMKLVWERCKIVIEPSAAVGVAVALYSEKFRSLKGIESVGIILTGGNVDLMNLPW